MARDIRRRVEIFLRRVWKDKQYKNSTKYTFGTNEALVCYRKTEKAKAALADINVDQGWTAEWYRSTSKDEQIRVNEGYRKEKNNAVEKSQQKEREYKYQ